MEATFTVGLQEVGGDYKLVLSLALPPLLVDLLVFGDFTQTFIGEESENIYSILLF